MLRPLVFPFLNVGKLLQGFLSDGKGFFPHFGLMFDSYFFSFQAIIPPPPPPPLPPWLSSFFGPGPADLFGSPGMPGLKVNVFVFLQPSSLPPPFLNLFQAGSLGFQFPSSVLYARDNGSPPTCRCPPVFTQKMVTVFFREDGGKFLWGKSLL